MQEVSERTDLIYSRRAQRWLGAPLDNPAIRREVMCYINSSAVQRVAKSKIETGRLDAQEYRSREDTNNRFCRTRLDGCSRSPVIWRFEPKSTGGFRQVCRFSDSAKVYHLMAKDIVHALHRPAPHIGDWKGRGRDQQIAEIKASLHSPEQYVVYADVISCFANVNVDSMDASMSMADDEASPCGLLEGSPASNALWGVMIDDLPGHLPMGVTPFSYCDNIVLIAPNEELAQQSQLALVSYFRRHRAGPFDLRIRTRASTEQFEHLGYQIHFIPGQGTWIGLSERNSKKFRGKVSLELESDASEPNDISWGAIRWLSSCFGQITPCSAEIYVHEAMCYERED